MRRRVWWLVWLGLVLWATGAHAMSLAWDYLPGSGATQFNVYQQAHCVGPFVLVSTQPLPTPAPTAPFTATWAIPATLLPDCYRWYVTAANSTAESALSNVVTWQIAAPAPSNLRTQ